MKLAWRTCYGWAVWIGIGAGMLAIDKKFGAFDPIYKLVGSAWPAGPGVDWKIQLDVAFLFLLAITGFPAFLMSAFVILRTGVGRARLGKVAVCAAGAAFVPGLVAIGLDKVMGDPVGWVKWAGYGILLLSLPLAWCAFWALRSQERG